MSELFTPLPLQEYREPEKQKHQNPYIESALVEDVLQSVNSGQYHTLFFTDLDSATTYAADRNVQVQNRTQMDARGSVIIATSRTSEMCMSEEQYSLSDRAIRRPVPQLRVVSGEGEGQVIDDKRSNTTNRYTKAFPSELPEYAGLIDPHAIIATTGAEVLIKQTNGGYRGDEEYMRRVGTHPETGIAWRENALTLVATLKHLGVSSTLEVIEHDGMFEAGMADVAPTNHRVVVKFENYEEMGRFMQAHKGIQEVLRQGKLRGIPLEATLPSDWAHLDPHLLLNTTLINDSKTNNRGQLYMVPNGVSKTNAVRATVRGIQEGVRHHLQNEYAQVPLRLVTVGDSLADIGKGLDIGPQMGMDSVFVLAGGSRLTATADGSLISNFAHRDLTPIAQRLERLDTGIYRYHSPYRNNPNFHPNQHAALVVIGDQRYPGTQEGETLAAFLADTNFFTS